MKTACWPHLLLTLGFAALAVASALSRSAAPVVLGRYSRALFACQLWNVAALACLLGPARWAGVRSVGAVLAVGATFLVPMNDAVRHLPGLTVALPLVRLLAGVTLVAREFDRFRAGERPVRGAFVALGSALGVLAVLDLALWLVVRARPDFGEDFDGFRDHYDLRALTRDDVVLIGDSFVWGHGVAKSERFGNVLERLYADEGRRTRVFSLGIRATGPDRYVESLARVPSRDVGAVICAFYPNDLTPRPRPQWKNLRRLQRLTWNLGWSSLTFRALHDLMARVETPTVADYHRAVVRDYRKDDPTFAARWDLLSNQLDQFRRLSAERTPAPPLLVILPLMVDFRDYPLAQAHEDLKRLAERLGYEVLDLLPAFRRILVDGNRFRISSRDNHFDARAHALVATLLKERLDSLPATAGLGRR